MIPGWSSFQSESTPVEFRLPVPHVVTYRDSGILAKPTTVVGRVLGEAEVGLVNAPPRELAVELRFIGVFDVALVDRIA